MGILLCEQNFREVWRRNENVRAEFGQILHTHTRGSISSIKGLCKVKKIPKIIWKWVGGSRSHLDKKKIGKLSKNKVLHLYNSPLLGSARGASSMQHFIPYSVIL